IDRRQHVPSQPALYLDRQRDVLIYFTYVTSFLSVWFIVGLTFERYIAICFPLKRTFLCSVKREKNSSCRLNPGRLCFIQLKFMDIWNGTAWTKIKMFS
ncbi:hypothetical protein MAR_034762, partial [Mya arenaria]